MTKELTIKVLNKQLAFIAYGDGSPHMVENPFETAKAVCVYETNKKNLPLPRFGYDIYRFEDSYPDLVRWYEALRKRLPYENSHLVDFSKPFNEKLVEEVCLKNTEKKGKIQINPDDLINAELED